MTKELSKFFKKLGKNTIKILNKYWDDELGAFHLNKVHDLIIESEEEYRNILYKYAKKEYDKSRKATQRRYKQQLKKISIKSDINIDYLESLFQPNKKITSTLENKVFLSARSTMDRVDNKINKVISEGYYEGLGVKAVGDRLTKEYSSLSSWEANRIARTEINCASNDAAFDEYYDNDVEFQQWWTGQDERVRTSHQDLHGKIVRVGSKFSNGLLYPGDRSGMVKEWINCRCTTVPFLMPLGKMAPPGMVEFTESDLVDIPGFIPISVEDAIRGNYDIKYYKTINNYANTPGMDFNRLTPGEQKYFMDLQEELEDYKKEIKLLESKRDTGEIDALKEYVEDLEDEIIDYERIISDENILVEDNVRIKFKAGSNVEGLNHDERFRKYIFKKEGVSIYESLDAPVQKVNQIKKYYDDLPDELKRTKEIVLSNNAPQRYREGFLPKPIGGYVLEESKSKRVYIFTKNLKGAKETLTHELAHLIEKDDGFYISNSQEWINAVKTDANRLAIQGETSIENRYVSTYGYDFLTGKYGDARNGREYSELFAEAVKKYFADKKAFKNKFPEQAKVIEKVLNGKFNKNAIPHKEYFNQNLNKYKLTTKQIIRANELEIKRLDKGLTNSELAELTALEEQEEFNILHNYIIENKPFRSVSDIKRYKELSKKLEKKLNLNLSKNKDILYDLSDNKGEFNLNSDERKEYERLLLKQKTEKLKFKERRLLKKLEDKINKPVDLNHSKDINNIKEKKVVDDKYLGDITNPKNYKQFKGTTKDGMLPGNESIDKYFTTNVSTTGIHDEIINKWVYHSEYGNIQFYHNDLNWDEKKLREWVKTEYTHLSKEEQEIEIQEILNNWKQFKRLMEGSKLKKNMVLHRTQEKLHMGLNPKVGDKVTINSYRSTSISREGMNYYKDPEELDRRKNWWNLTIEAPAGTKGAYISPKALDKEKNNKYISQMEVILGPDTPAEILEINYETKEILLRVIV